MPSSPPMCLLPSYYKVSDPLWILRRVPGMRTKSRGGNYCKNQSGQKGSRSSRTSRSRYRSPLMPAAYAQMETTTDLATLLPAGFPHPGVTITPNESTSCATLDATNPKKPCRTQLWSLRLYNGGFSFLRQCKMIRELYTIMYSNQ